MKIWNKVARLFHYRSYKFKCFLNSIKGRGVFVFLKDFLILLFRSFLDKVINPVLLTLLGFKKTIEIYLFFFRFKSKYNPDYKKRLWLGGSISRKSHLCFINPKEISYRLEFPNDRYYIENGNWDLNRKKFEINQTVKDIFVKKIPYKRTGQYKFMKKAMENKKYHESYWCENEKDIDNYFNRLIKAYNSIKTGGYKTQGQLKKEDKNGKYQKNDEIRVVIDRNGKMLHYSGGDHRLSIAKLLGIKKIPVRIVKIHYNFFKRKMA